MRWVALLALSTACDGAKTIDRQAAKDVFEQVTIVAPPGMSDLAVDDRGVLWAVSERDRQVLEIELGKPPVVHPLDGVPFGHDTEGIAWLGDERFAIATESAMAPVAAVLFAERRDGKLVITRTREVTSEELGVAMTPNHGLEAACGRGNELLAASETVGKLPDGTRYAPIVRLRDDVLTVTKVRLTTDRGKISALHCTFDEAGTAEVIAIERHFGVCRILRFSLARGAVEVTPTVELDLHPIVRDALNLEGIARLPDGRLVAINDNQSKRVKGPTQLLVFAKR